ISVWSGIELSGVPSFIVALPGSVGVEPYGAGPAALLPSGIAAFHAPPAREPRCQQHGHSPRVCPFGSQFARLLARRGMTATLCNTTLGCAISGHAVKLCVSLTDQ